MDAERPDDALTGLALDREIRALLAVDPSPELVARVRMRIASDPARATSRLFWTFGAVGAMAAVIAVAVVVSRDARTSRLRDSASQPDVAQAFRPADVPVVSGFSRTSAGVEPVVSVRLKPDATEVLLDPAETRALRRLITGTREGTLDLSASLQATTPTAMDLPPVSEIAIPFITIDPITPQAGEEGAPQ